MDPVRVGRITYAGAKQIVPHVPGYRPVIVMTASSPYAQLSPYLLKNSNGQIMENIWQFSKVYSTVPSTIQRYSRYDDRVIWNHPSEQHLRDNAITSEYVQW